MAKYFLEPYDPDVHRNHMSEIDSVKDMHGSVIVLEIQSYRLEFLSIAQIDAAIAYFQKPNISTRTSDMSGDHWEFQSWISRLPKGINNAKNRIKCLNCLLSARQEFANGVHYRPVSA